VSCYSHLIWWKPPLQRQVTDHKLTVNDTVVVTLRAGNLHTNQNPNLHSIRVTVTYKVVYAVLFMNKSKVTLVLAHTNPSLTLVYIHTTTHRSRALLLLCMLATVAFFSSNDPICQQIYETRTKEGTGKDMWHNYTGMFIFKCCFI
jgi:glycerol uptake facilitator-like aquaporin